MPELSVWVKESFKSFRRRASISHIINYRTFPVSSGQDPIIPLSRDGAHKLETYMVSYMVSDNPYCELHIGHHWKEKKRKKAMNWTKSIWKRLAQENSCDAAFDTYQVVSRD